MHVVNLSSIYSVHALVVEIMWYVFLFWQLTVIGVCGLNGDHVQLRVMSASSEEIDLVPIPIQTNMAIIVLGNPGTIESVWRHHVQVCAFQLLIWLLCVTLLCKLWQLLIC